MALKWGIVGVGMIAHDFLTALGTLRSSEHQVVAVAGNDLDKAHSLATLHKVSIAYEGYDGLASDKEIEIVYVSVGNSQHFEIVKLMLERGKHVLCEKPMCMSHIETQVLVDLARKEKLFLMEGMWSRFFPAYDALSKHITSGEIGEVLQVNAQFGVGLTEVARNLMKDFGGGVILDLGVYLLQFSQMVFKEEPVDVVCAGHTSALGVDESMSCVLTYGGGKTATLTAHTHVAMENDAHIIGTKGTIKVSKFWCPDFLELPNGDLQSWNLPEGHFRFNFFNSAGLSYEAEECRRCIREGLLESSKMSLSDSLVLAKLQDTLRKQLGVLCN